MHGSDPRIGTADGKVRRCGLAALADGDPKGGEERQSQRAVKNSPPAEITQERMDDADHGVRPVR
ncbi:hypothetical protein [Aliiroseovarius sp. xm-a-151]|uniref:hypothetical protein n=1 Tax=Aliiroseovarius sp. xm-a-151 TaxID=2651824 RepID=UPI001568A075|nr:hypothetical protein [Aliiroseovarius sp. xm-a-151]